MGYFNTAEYDIV